MRRLILFDVDGTLITTSGKAFQALKQAFFQVAGKPAPADGFSPAGKTDPQIFLEFLERAAIHDARVLLPQLQATYLELLPSYLQAQHVTTLPGVRQTLGFLAQKSKVALGLLTGNLQAGAQLKLERAELWHYFAVGGFGSDDADRNQLLPHAVRRAEDYFRTRFPYEQVVVVGDTPADIRCAQVWGAKAIAVAGPTTSATTLAREKAHAVVPSLEPELFLPVLAALAGANLDL